MRIATGEDDDTLTDDGKDKAAVSLGKRWGAARAEKRASGRKSDIASKAAKARWKK